MGGLHMIRLAEMMRKSPQDLAELQRQLTFIDAGDIIKIIKPDKTRVFKVVRLEDGINLHLEYSEE
jgi:hypothetical protein